MIVIIILTYYFVIDKSRQRLGKARLIGTYTRDRHDMSSCKECGHPTEWAQDIGSAVCTQCGTLADSSQQSALTSSVDFCNSAYSHPLPSSSTCAPTTLKSVRRNTAWDLPGQGADSRKERKKVSRFFPSHVSFPHSHTPPRSAVQHPRTYSNTCRSSGSSWCGNPCPSNL